MQLICVGIVNSAGSFFIRSEFLRLFLMSAQIGRNGRRKILRLPFPAVCIRMPFIYFCMPSDVDDVENATVATAFHAPVSTTVACAPLTI